MSILQTIYKTIYDAVFSQSISRFHFNGLDTTSYYVATKLKWRRVTITSAWLRAVIVAAVKWSLARRLTVVQTVAGPVASGTSGHVLVAVVCERFSAGRNSDGPKSPIRN